MSLLSNKNQKKIFHRISKEIHHMSEKFNPLAEAESNASHDRRRFYDWVGDNADHEDNESFRAANADMAEYLKSRDYTDDNGALHDAESAKFKSNPNGEAGDEYYNRLQAESETDGPFEHASLKQLAEMIHEARSAGDKTLENDAREAFDDKFMAMAEKYDWQGTVENEDGTVTDRNAIADSKLAYYEDIMNGAGAKPAEKKAEKPAAEGTSEEKKEADSNDTADNQSDDSAKENSTEAPEQEEASEETDADEEDAKDKPEEQPKKSEKTSDDEFDQNDMAELRKKLDAQDAKEEYKPKHRAEFADEDTPLFDAVKNDLGQSEEVARENESRKEYEARQPGRHARTGAAADLEILEEDVSDKKVDAKDLEILEEDEPAEKDRAGIRARDWLRHPLAAAGGALVGATTKAERSGENNDRSRRRKRLAGFILFGSAIGGGLLMMKGHNPFDHSTHGVLDNLPTVPEVPPAGTDPNVPPVDGIDIINLSG